MTHTTRDTEPRQRKIYFFHKRVRLEKQKMPGKKLGYSPSKFIREIEQSYRRLRQFLRVLEQEEILAECIRDPNDNRPIEKVLKNSNRYLVEAKKEDEKLDSTEVKFHEIFKEVEYLSISPRTVKRVFEYKSFNEPVSTQGIVVKLRVTDILTTNCV